MSKSKKSNIFKLDKKTRFAYASMGLFNLAEMSNCAESEEEYQEMFKEITCDPEKYVQNVVLLLRSVGASCPELHYAVHFEKDEEWNRYDKYFDNLDRAERKMRSKISVRNIDLALL